MNCGLGYSRFAVVRVRLTGSHLQIEKEAEFEYINHSRHVSIDVNYSNPHHYKLFKSAKNKCYMHHLFTALYFRYNICLRLSSIPVPACNYISSKSIWFMFLSLSQLHLVIKSHVKLTSNILHGIKIIRQSEKEKGRDET